MFANDDAVDDTLLSHGEDVSCVFESDLGNDMHAGDDAFDHDVDDVFGDEDVDDVIVDGNVDGVCRN